MRELLQKLMFWKKPTVELDYDVNGCFTLPEERGTEVAGSSEAASAADPE